MSNERMTDDLNRRRTRFVKNLVSSSKTAIAQLEESSDCPDGMKYFLDIMKKNFVDIGNEENSLKSKENIKTIGTYCMMTPEELIYAADAKPVRLCGGSYAASLAGDEFAPRDTCPIVKASVGFTAMGLLPMYEECDAVIVPTTCDGKRKMGDILSQYVEVWPLDVPPLKDNDDSRERWLHHLYGIKNTLESKTGNKITYDKLKQAIKQTAEAQHEARRLYEFKKYIPGVISGTHTMMIMNSYAYDTVKPWTQALNALNNVIEEKIAKKEHIRDKKAPRILFTGAPIVFPNIRLPMLIEELGGIIAVDETCMGDRYLYDPVGVTEESMDGMMRALAARYIMPCTCPSFTYNEDRIYKLRQMVKDFKIDGIIYHVLRGCLPYDFELNEIEKDMNSRNIPVLRVETDYNPEDIEQLKIRIEAFMEMINARKKRG